MVKCLLFIMIILLSPVQARAGPVEDDIAKISRAVQSINKKLAAVDKNLSVALRGHEERIRMLKQNSEVRVATELSLISRIGTLERENFSIKIGFSIFFSVLLVLIGSMNLNTRSWRKNNCMNCEE